MNMKVGQEPFNRLVRLAARAFYDDFTTKGDNLPKTRSDNRGIAVIVLDALTRRQWVREEDLAKDLKIHMKQLRRTLRFFEEEKLIMRDHRKETAKGVKLHSAAVAATSEGHPHGKEGDDKIKLHTHSYCCLDYAQLFDVVRYRMHRMKKKLKDELESRNTIQEYICPNCNKRYTALDAARLVSMEDEYFHCENCNGELVAESEKLASQDAGDGDDNARRRRREKLQELLQKLEVQLKPLVDQLNAVRDLSVPEFGTLQAWEVRASAALRAANGGLNVNDASRSGGTPMPYLEETKIEVAISDVQATEHGNKAAAEITPTKLLPPWMIRQSMNLTKEQRGVVKEESKMEESTSPDDKRTPNNDDAKSYQDEFLKAYYAALYQRQQEAVQNQRQESSNEQQLDNLESSSQRQVGMKSKREDEDAEKDDDWEDDGTNTAGNINYKVTDLNLEADPIPTSDEGEDDDLEWEEG